jgi:DNA mismatch endonuclease (patch repair protein)
MDKLTPEQRHKNMAAIHSKNTKPELIVRRFLFAHGFRFRLNHPRLPGHPDIVLRRYATCVFVNGCFWHGHEGCSKFVMPKSNTAFWQAKIERNRERDQRNYDDLMSAGWQVIVIWECNLAKDKQENTMQQVALALNRKLLKIAIID